MRIGWVSDKGKWHPVGDPATNVRNLEKDLGLPPYSIARNAEIDYPGFCALVKYQKQTGIWPIREEVVMAFNDPVRYDATWAANTPRDGVPLDAPPSGRGTTVPFHPDETIIRRGSRLVAEEAINSLMTWAVKAMPEAHWSTLERLVREVLRERERASRPKPDSTIR